MISSFCLTRTQPTVLHGIAMSPKEPRGNVLRQPNAETEEDDKDCPNGSNATPTLPRQDDVKAFLLQPAFGPPIPLVVLRALLRFAQGPAFVIRSPPVKVLIANASALANGVPAHYATVEAFAAAIAERPTIAMAMSLGQHGPWEYVLAMSRPRIRAAHASALWLTPRQIHVGALLARGLSNKEIAFALQSTTKTIEKHVSSLLHKLRAGSRTEFVARLLETNE